MFCVLSRIRIQRTSIYITYTVYVCIREKKSEWRKFPIKTAPNSKVYFLLMSLANKKIAFTLIFCTCFFSSSSTQPNDSLFLLPNRYSSSIIRTRNYFSAKRFIGFLCPVHERYEYVLYVCVRLSTFIYRLRIVVCTYVALVCNFE